MRVAHFLESFSARTETFLYDYITEIARQGIDTHVVTLDRLYPDERPFQPVYVIPLPPRFHPSRVGSRLKVILRLTSPEMQYVSLQRRFLSKAIYSIRPQVIHAHFGIAGVLVAPIARQQNIPLIVSFHGFDVYKLPQMDVWRNQYRSLFNDLTLATCVSEIMRERLIELGLPQPKIHIVHVGKNLAQYPYREPKLPICRFISVGSLAEKKGHMDTIRAFSSAARESAATLTIVGGGYLREELQACIDNHGMHGRIMLLGELVHTKVIEHMRESDVFILSSRTASNGDKEGIPTVLMEAQALGLPCISTWHSGIPEVIPEQNQMLLAEEGNIAQLSAHISSVCNMNREQLLSISRRGRELIESKFELTQEVRKIISLYRQCDGAKYV